MMFGYRNSIQWGLNGYCCRNHSRGHHPVFPVLTSCRANNSFVLQLGSTQQFHGVAHRRDSQPGRAGTGHPGGNAPPAGRAAVAARAAGPLRPQALRHAAAPAAGGASRDPPGGLQCQGLRPPHRLGALHVPRHQAIHEVPAGNHPNLRHADDAGGFQVNRPKWPILTDIVLSDKTDSLAIADFKKIYSFNRQTWGRKSLPIEMTYKTSMHFCVP